MKKLISILAVLTLLVSCAIAEDTDNTIIGGADATTSIFLTETDESAFGSITLSFDANITTGYTWTAFIIGGDSVEIDEKNSGYVSDPNPDFKDGVGGTHYFKLNALKPGESMVRFTYSRGQDDIADEIYMLIVVEDDLLIYAMDVTEASVYGGTVVEVNAEDHSVMLNTDRMGEVIARFDENEALPAQGEHIMVYTNGTATMSLPAIINVIAWSSIPTDEARDPMNGYAYTYSGEGFGSDFKITFFEDGTFTYCEGALSSHIGYGNWTEAEDVLVLTDIGMGPDSPIINQFHVADGQMRWIGEGSDNFMYIKLQDGATFSPAE